MITLLSVRIMDYFRDTGTSLAELRDAVRPPDQPSPLETIIARAVDRGELADRPYPARVVNLPFDLYRHEVFMTMKPVPDDVIHEIIDEAWLPLLRGRPGGAAS